MPRVSIVLTAYNRAEALRRTLRTLVVQTFTDFELLVCDDASPDHTEAVVREFSASDPRVIYVGRERNLGMPGNLNEGIRQARGEYIANLHDGDLYDPYLLEEWSKALDRHPNAAFVFNQYRLMGADGSERISSEDLPPVVSGHRLLEDIYFRRWRFDSPVWGTVMGRRSLYMDSGLFDPRFGCIADVDMWMRLAERNDVAYVAKPLITLPSSEELPRNWTIPAETLRTIYWESRHRHYNKNTFRLAAELVRHMRFSASCRMLDLAVRAKAALKSRPADAQMAGERRRT